MVRTAAGYEDGDSDDVTECPECKAEIYIIADRCPKCGHWFIEQDRRAMHARRRNEVSSAETAGQLRMVKIGAVILIALATVFLIAAGIASILMK